MKRALLVGLLVVALVAVFAFSAPSASAAGPCDGKYGGYAGCSMHGGYMGGGYMGAGACNGPYGGYAGCSMQGGYMGGYGGKYMMGAHFAGYGYNRVCTWASVWTKWGWHKQLVCSYRLVPPWPISGYYGYKMSYGSGYWGY